MQPNTYKYMQIHTNTNKYIQIHTNINKYTQIRTNSSKWIIVYSFHIKKKNWKRQKLSADFALKNRRWYHYFSFNFSAKRAKLTSRCFLRSEIYVFAAFWFDEKRHPIRKVSPSPVSADSAPIFHSESEIGEEFSDSVTTRSVSDDVRKGSHDQAAIPILRTAVNCRELPWTAVNCRELPWTAVNCPKKGFWK